MSHGGSGKQSRAIIDGLDADVATLALAYDIDAIAKRGRGPPRRLAGAAAEQQRALHLDHRLPRPQGQSEADPRLGRSRPAGRQGHHPQSEDQRRRPLELPRRLGLWPRQDGSEAAARDFVTRLYRNVPVLDTGARGSTTTFAERGIGDVLIAWENEAFLAQRELGAGKFEIVTPSLSILAEPPVALLEGNARRGTAQVAEAYLRFLYTPEAQEIIARHYYRPRDPAVAAKHSATFPKVAMLEIDKDFGGWNSAQKKYFDDGGIFDTLYAGLRRR